MHSTLLCMLQVTFASALCNGVSLTDLFRDLPGLCRCPEVVCDENRQISEMNFEAANLNGTIPDEIGTLGPLQHLKVLNLCKNNLHGELPKTLPSLGQLQVLCVGSNSLRGDLNVGGMPIWWNFSDIKTLILDHNFFTGKLHDAPSVKMPKLRHFSIGNNILTGEVPQYLYDNAKNLEWLVLSANNFTGEYPLEKITKHLHNLTLLSIGSPDDEVYAKRWHESTIPDSVASLVSLKVLDLTNSRLYGTIPTLTKPGTGSLRHVLLHRNQLTGIIPPTLMKDNRDLETLTLYNNELVGNIPSPISPKMSRIYLQGNRLAGYVPVRNASVTAPPIKACVIPGNAFAREEQAFGKQMENNGLPSWIPKNTSQVSFFALSGMGTVNDPDTLAVLMLYLVVSFVIFVATAGLIVLPKASQLMNPLPSARSNIRATATPEATAFFKLARQLFYVCVVLSVFCACNAVIFYYGAEYYAGFGGVAYNTITLTYLQTTPQKVGMSPIQRDWSQLAPITGAVFLTFFDIAVMCGILFLHVRGKGGSVFQWWGEKSVWEVGLASRRQKPTELPGNSLDSTYRDGVDTFEWVQKRGRVLSEELDDDIGYQSMNSDDTDYSGRHSGSEYMGGYVEQERVSHNSPNFPSGMPTINGSASNQMGNMSISSPRCPAKNERTVGVMICIAVPTLLWWLFMLLLAALVAMLKVLYYVPNNNVFNIYNPREILLLWDALLTAVILASNSVFIPAATQILRPMMCCCEEEPDFAEMSVPGAAPRPRRRSAPFAIVMFSRLLITVFVPVLTIMVMDQHCFAFYRSFYDVCAPSSASDWDVDFEYPRKQTADNIKQKLTVMNFEQFCGVHTDNVGECSRSILGFLGPFYFKLLCCMAFVQPAIVLCLGRCGRRVSSLDEQEQEDEDDAECFPSGRRKPKEKSFLPGCKEMWGRSRLGLQNQGPLLLSLFELLVIFGGFVPPLMILGLVAICTNAIAVRFNLQTMAWKPTQILTRDVDGNLSDSLGRKPPALGWYTAVGFVLLYIMQVAFYFENHLDGCAILAISLPVLAIITGTVYALRRWCEQRKLKPDDDEIGMGDNKSDPFLTTGF